jgi:class 3 adenylate cyclase
MEGGFVRLERPVPYETQRLIVLLAGLLILFAAGGGAAMSLFAAELVLHPAGLWIVCGIGALLGAFVVSIYVVDAPFSHSHFIGLALGLQVVTPLLISAAQYTIGPRTVLPFLLYVEVTIFSFYLMPMVLAFCLTGLEAVELAVVMLVQPGYSAAVAQWAFLVGTVIAVGAVFGGLLRRALDEVGRFDRLRRFLPDQVATTLLESGNDDVLKPHRREIAVLFCDLRGFTRFASNAAPEEVVDLLAAYYRTAAERLQAARATVGALAGDGVMAYFNDPVPCPDPAGTAVRVAVEVRDALERLKEEWDDKGFHLGYGIGIAFGYATLGTIGFEARSDYTALGPVVNLASRLCAEAQPGEILIDQRTYAAVRRHLGGADERRLQLKGYQDAVRAHAVSGLVAPANGSALASGVS